MSVSVRLDRGKQRVAVEGKLEEARMKKTEKPAPDTQRSRKRRGEAGWEEYNRENSRRRQERWVREKAAETSSHVCEVAGWLGLGVGG